MSPEERLPEQDTGTQPQSSTTPEEAVPPISADGGPGDEPEDPVAALAIARAEAQANYDRFLRAAAELDNYRKRTARVRMEVREDVLRDVLLSIAPVLDNLGRALSQESEEVQALKQGVALIYSQFQEVLRSFGLEVIEAKGQPFDPTVHEALMEVPSPDQPPGTVIEVMEKGYTLNNKVVRPSRVIVSRGNGADAA
ncbi:MAG: nucleotide exchange factor GrpE [Candidatus Latescibacterota bacterium]